MDERRLDRLRRLAELGDLEAIHELDREERRRGIPVSEERLARHLDLNPHSINRDLARTIGEHIGMVGGIGPMLSESLRRARWQMLRRIAKTVYQAHGPLRDLKVAQLVAEGQIPSELPVPLTRPQLEERREFEQRINDLERDEDAQYRYEPGSESWPPLVEWLGIKWWGYYLTEEVIQVLSTEDDYEQIGEATHDHTPWVIEEMQGILQAHNWRDTNINADNRNVEFFGEEEDTAPGFPVIEGVYYVTNLWIARDTRGGTFPADLTEEEIEALSEISEMNI